MKAILKLEDGREIKVEVEQSELILSNSIELEPWKPVMAERYWFVNDRGNVDYNYWDNDFTDQWLYGQGNVWRSEDEGLGYLIYLKAKAKIRTHAITANQGWKPDWSDIRERKYFPRYDHILDEIDVDYYCETKYLGTTYYRDEEKTRQAIKELRQEYLTVFKWEASHE